MPWIPSRDTKLYLSLLFNRLYAILPAPFHTSLPILNHVCCLPFVSMSRDATRSPELLLLRRLRVFLVGLSWCVLLRFKPLFHFMHVAMFPSVDTSLSVLIQTFHLSHLVSRFLRSLWMYSFRLLVNVPLRLVSAVGLGQCELRFGAPVLFSACAPLCVVHFSPRANSAQARCSNMRPASLGVWSLRKVPRKVPVGRLALPDRSAGSACVSG